MKLSYLSIVVIFFLLIGCNFAKNHYEYKVNCKGPDVFEFNLKGSFIKYEITGYLEEDADIYVQSFSDEHNGVWDLVALKKGNINHKSVFETYEPRGRIIFLPKGDRSIHYNSKKEKLTVKIQTGYDWF